MDEPFSWLQSKIEEKLDLPCKKEDFAAEFKTLRDTVASLSRKLDEHGTTTAMLLEFRESFAQSLQETQNSMTEQQKTLADQLKQMGAIRENMNKLPALVDKIKGMPPETLNYWGMVEALLNKLSAELTAVHAALREVHAQAQVTHKLIHDVKDNVAIVKGAMNTAQGGTPGVQPVTVQPEAAVQVQKPKFKTPAKPQQVSLDQTIPATRKPSAPAPDVGALLAQIAQFQQAVQAMQAKQHQ